MKKLIFIVIGISIYWHSLGQVNRLRVGFVPYTDPDYASAEHRELAYKNLFEMALRIFINTQRFIALDRSSFNIVKIEKEFQKGEDLINSDIIEQGKVLAAQVLIIAKISTFTVTEADDGEGFSVFLAAELKQVDVETAKAARALQLKSEVVDGKANLLNEIGIKKKRITSAEEAINLAVNKLEKELDKWIKEQFSLMMQVLDKEDNEMALIVDGGKQTGLSRDYKLRAVKMKMLNGRKYVDTLAKLSFSNEGLGEETTKLIVTNKLEWEKLLNAWNEDKNTILVFEDTR